AAVLEGLTDVAAAVDRFRLDDLELPIDVGAEDQGEAGNDREALDRTVGDPDRQRVRALFGVGVIATDQKTVLAVGRDRSLRALAIAPEDGRLVIGGDASFSLEAGHHALDLFAFDPDQNGPVAVEVVDLLRRVARTGAEGVIPAVGGGH